MKALRELLTSGHRTLEPRPEVQDEYADRYQSEISQMVWAHESVKHSHFKNPERADLDHLAVADPDVLDVDQDLRAEGLRLVLRCHALAQPRWSERRALAPRTHLVREHRGPVEIAEDEQRARRHAARRTVRRAVDRVPDSFGNAQAVVGAAAGRRDEDLLTLGADDVLHAFAVVASTVEYRRLVVQTW